MKIRRYSSVDFNEIAELFYNTVHLINIKDYSKEQVNVWATGEIDYEKWNKSLEEHYSIVVIENEVIIGFGDIDDTGYLDRIYVHKDYQSRGVGTLICNELERKCKTENILVHASITAKPFFEGRGYRVIKEQEVERNGVKLKNFIMKKENN
ncbi:MAG: GNAT family N-acetyltransferase [Clostridium sp.]|uniref:GNAT family N-acetyltransferase n=1 Tax=Clostridium sp. TaxID=1506 RepID=UPI0029107B0B|nr:GNAT family N-acetyltransferase [Clostridium sp.]MDU5111605.1 GNAT family N-acetyltransferase [Clostridium sp.]